MSNPVNLTTERARGYRNLRPILYEKMHKIFKNIKYDNLDDMRIRAKKLVQIAKCQSAMLVLLQHRNERFDRILEINLTLHNIKFVYIQ